MLVSKNVMAGVGRSVLLVVASEDDMARNTGFLKDAPDKGLLKIASGTAGNGSWTMF